MMVFGVPNLFCAASLVPAELARITVATQAMRIHMVIESSPCGHHHANNSRPTLARPRQTVWCLIKRPFCPVHRLTARRRRVEQHARDTRARCRGAGGP